MIDEQIGICTCPEFQQAGMCMHTHPAKTVDQQAQAPSVESVQDDVADDIVDCTSRTRAVQIIERVRAAERVRVIDLLDAMVDGSLWFRDAKIELKKRIRIALATERDPATGAGEGRQRHD